MLKTIESNWNNADIYDIPASSYNLKVNNTLIKGFKTEDIALETAQRICEGLSGIEIARSGMDLSDSMLMHGISLIEVY